MPTVRACDLPADALLSVYSRKHGCYADCFSIEVARDIELSDYIAAFYTTPLFKLERVILKLAMSMPSTDRQAQQLADAQTDRFSAWTVERRTEEQLLMCDRSGRTRSWFMVEPNPNGKLHTTRLCFGSAVVPAPHGAAGEKTPGFGFSALLGFHKLYSRALLSAAKSRLEK